VSWLGLFTNIVAVPVMGLLLVPMGLLAGVGQILSGGTALPLTSLLQLLIDWFVEGVNFVARVPGGEWHVASPSIVTMIVFYACLGVIWFRSERVFFRMTAGAGVTLLLLWWIWSPRILLDGDRFRVTFLDVGQGDSAVIEWPDGRVVVIDGGATYERFDMGRRVVAPYLWNRGIRTIDHMVGTHPQLDHVGGLAWLLRHFSVKHYWGTGDGRDELFYRNLLQALAERGLAEQKAKEGQEILSSHDCRLTVLNPPEAPVTPEYQSASYREGHLLNNHSIVTELTCGTHRFLFAADVEQDSLRRMQLKPRPEPVAVLKVPHHGAISSLNAEWIAGLRPQHAVFSVGRHNPYGHPAPKVVDAYAGQGASIYRTDRDGGVWIAGKSSDSNLQVHRTRDEKLQPTVLSSCIWDCEMANWHRLVGQWMD
jgi:competence protein ComEC